MPEQVSAITYLTHLGPEPTFWSQLFCAVFNGNLQQVRQVCYCPILLPSLVTHIKPEASRNLLVWIDSAIAWPKRPCGKLSATARAKSRAMTFSAERVAMKFVRTDFWRLIRLSQ